MTGKVRYRCSKCGERFVAWARAQRHANDSGHARVGMSEKELAGSDK